MCLKSSVNKGGNPFSMVPEARLHGIDNRERVSRGCDRGDHIATRIFQIQRVTVTGMDLRSVVQNTGTAGGEIHSREIRQRRKAIKRVGRLQDPLPRAAESIIRGGPRRRRWRSKRDAEMLAVRGVDGREVGRSRRPSELVGNRTVHLVAGADEEILYLCLVGI